MKTCNVLRSVIAKKTHNHGTIYILYGGPQKACHFHQVDWVQRTFENVEVAALKYYNRQFYLTVPPTPLENLMSQIMTECK